MHIAHVVQSLGTGGQERLVLNLSRSLIQLGHSISIVTLTPGGDLRQQFEGIPVFTVPRAPGVHPSLSWRLSRLFAQLRPDVVHTHNRSPLIYGAPGARLAGVPRVIHTKHGVNPYGAASILAQRIMLGLLHAFVAVSRPTALVARRQDHVPERLLHTIENGIPLESFYPNTQTRTEVRQQLGIPKGAFVVGSVGRLAPEKNYPLLVRSLLPILSPDRRLILVGQGPSEPEIRASIPPELSAYVTLTGARTDIPRLLSAFDVFALTSLTEGLPLAVPEAMACGLPVVATRVGSLPDIIDEHTGVLVESRDWAGLSRVFAALCSQHERCRAMGEAARKQAVARFSIHATAQAYASLYAGSGA